MGLETCLFQRPPMDFTDLSRLPLSLHEPPPIPGQPETIQLLSEGATPRSSDCPNWCQCGKCLPSQLPERQRCLEELCCRKKLGACITTSEPFKKLILSRHVLQFLLHYQEPLLVLDADSTNSQLRHCAYRCYTTWRFGSQDLADFAILPSCCRWRIRREFPKREGQYSGFKSPYWCAEQSYNIAFACTLSFTCKDVCPDFQPQGNVLSSSPSSVCVREQSDRSKQTATKLESLSMDWESRDSDLYLHSIPRKLCDPRPLTSVPHLPYYPIYCFTGILGEQIETVYTNSLFNA